MNVHSDAERPELERRSVPVETRVLPSTPWASLAVYRANGGGKGIEAARAVAPSLLLDELDASGLRGRGGAGFPTAAKWRTVAAHASAVLRTSVVVNAAEGEPGTFKDRMILRHNPYAVIEGALIAAQVVDARSIVIATKARFLEEVTSLRRAIDEMQRDGLTGDVLIDIVEGPDEYLYGEETALLEVVDGRPPFPRIAPPWRRGIVEVVADAEDANSGSGLAADVEMATEDDAVSLAPPVLVNNVETLANVPGIIANGAAWFRSVGTEHSPGTIVCTVTGAVQRPGVFEVPMGTSLRDVLALAAGDAEPPDDDRSAGEVVPAAVLMGASAAVVAAEDFDVEISYEAFVQRGSGLGSASFIVIGADADPVSVAAGVSHFLAVESCGQCTPCKQDGLEIASLLRVVGTGTGDGTELARIDERLLRITDGARCSLATQHQVVIGSLRSRFSGAFEAARPAADSWSSMPFAELADLADGVAMLDDRFSSKQPDWTYAGNGATGDDALDSGITPVERLTDHRADPA